MRTTAACVSRVVRLESVAIPPTLDPADPQALGELLGSVVRRSPIAVAAWSWASRAAASCSSRCACSSPVRTRANWRPCGGFQVEKELAFPADEAVIDFVVASHYDSPPHQRPGGRGSAGCAAGSRKLPVVEYYRKIAEAAKHKLLRASRYAHYAGLLPGDGGDREPAFGLPAAGAHDR